MITGIIGTSGGSGVTHLAVLTANYIAGICRSRCAVLEWNRHGDFERMERICTGKVTQNPYFSVLKADYYKSAGTKELLSCTESGYEQIVIDFGSDFHAEKTEFLRCGRKYVVAALSEWQVGGLLEFVEEMKPEAGYKSWEYGVAFGSEETRRELKKRFGLPLRRIPLSVDPFALNHEMMAYFES